jgi:hypothetical protein
MSEKPMFTFLGVLGIPALITQGEDRAYVVFEVARGEPLPATDEISTKISQGQISFMVPSAEGFLSVAVGPEDYDLFRALDEAWVHYAEHGGPGMDTFVEGGEETGKEKGPEKKVN